MIKPEDIHLSYVGSPNTHIGLRASLLYAVEAKLSESDEENQMLLQSAIFGIMDKAYDEVKADLLDIIEEYKMSHGPLMIQHDPVLDMIHKLLHKVSYHP